ncbi:hypothetical protein POM88_034784 [Heracleum sosnowskyi]|uniref:Late embryogenesis abundant protein n=1 Tax=Heracleum sosnowskyi TaxID=360622 RepID=A0AAD8HJY2_9APIA|nr:hypothetical protein POM88_034784 [Heracleum sosnowskyi]
MAGVASSIVKMEFLNVSKAYPQLAFQPKVSSVSFTSAFKYPKVHTRASGSDVGQQFDEIAQKTGENIKIGVEEAQNKVKNLNEKIAAEADGVVKATKETAGDIADKAKEGADQVASSAQSSQGKAEDQAASLKDKTVEAAENAVASAKETAQNIKEAVIEKLES